MSYKRSIAGQYLSDTVSIILNISHTNTFKVVDLCINNIVEYCWFVDANNELCNKEKRFVLYWCFATSVYLICGRHNMCDFPQCRIDDIRNLYPNPPGILYVGQKSALKKNMK